MAPELALFGLVVGGLLAATLVGSIGDVLNEPTKIDGNGVACVLDAAGELVPADPAALARGAGVGVDVLALARVMASEAGGLPWIAQVGVGWTVVNHCRDVGRSVLAVVTRAKLGTRAGAGDGFFGRQGHTTGGYRYVASSQDSTPDGRDTAAAILSGDLDDPTEGAVNFDSPAAYGAQEGTEEGGADVFASNRSSEGKIAIALPGVAESRLRFWRPV